MSFWKGKRVFVTGTTGFKGSWLSMWLVRRGATVVGLALAPDTEPSLYRAARIEETFATAIADVRDAEAVATALASARPDVVLHLAAQPLVRASYDAPVYTYAVNVMGTAHVLEAARKTQTVRAVVCVTTDKVYENREWVWPYRESDPLGGHDPYSSSKACAEILTASYARSFFPSADSAGVATARGGNVIGGGDWSADRIVPDLVRAFAAGIPAVVRNPSAVRPWQFVLDALHGYLLLAQRLYEEPHAYAEAWNFGPDAFSERPVAVVADALQSAWGKGAAWEHRAPAVARHEAGLLKLDSSKARSRLGWHDLVPADEAIARIAAWYAQFYKGADARTLMEKEFAAFESRLELAS